MTDNQLVVLLRSRIIQCLTNAGTSFAAIPVIQRQQPTQQGVPYERSVFFQKLDDEYVGWAKSTTTAQDATAAVFDWNEDQLIATKFQVSALSIQDPSNVASVTASDIVNMLAGALNHRATVEAFKSSRVNLQRVKILKNDPFEDDRHRAEYHPGFEVVLCHSRTTHNTVAGALPQPDGKVIDVEKTGTQPGQISADILV